VSDEPQLQLLARLKNVLHELGGFLRQIVIIWFVEEIGVSGQTFII
jgi:hypothetical protein